jgi:spermidine/putrescine transport system substrate-binding protein
VTYTGFMYAKDKIPAGVDVESWQVLGNPALKGKITLLDDLREVIGAGLMARGFSINSRDPAEIEAAVEEVLKWKQNIRKFDAESYKTEVASGATWLGQGYSTDATQVIAGDEEEGDAPRPDIGFALPKEGFTISFDEMVLSATSPEPDLAYAFMDYLYTAEASKANMEYNKGPMPVAPGIAALDEDYRKSIILPKEKLERGQVLKPVEDDPKVKELYDRAWDRVKATGDK